MLELYVHEKQMEYEQADLKKQSSQMIQVCEKPSDVPLKTRGWPLLNWLPLRRKLKRRGIGSKS